MMMDIPLDRAITPDEIRALIHGHDWFANLDLNPVAQPFLDAEFIVVHVDHQAEHGLWVIRMRVHDGEPWQDHLTLRRKVRAIIRESRIGSGEGGNVYRVRRPFFTCVFADPVGPPPFDPAWLEPVED